MEVCTNNNLMNMYNVQQQKAVSTTNQSNDVVSTSQKPLLEEPTSNKKKIAIGMFSALGVAASMMLLAKFDKSKKYSLNPAKIFKKGLKEAWNNSYLKNSDYKSKEIITMGAGSTLGGLVAGALLDKKENFQAKKREAIVQFTNISMPIVFVEGLSNAGKYISSKIMPNWDKSSSFLKKATSKLPPVIGSMGGLMAGMYIGNKFSNKLNEVIFKKKDDRPIEVTDFSAHIDDICVAATFVAENNPLTKLVSRFIPCALMVAGNEIGSKKENLVDKSQTNNQISNK